MNKTHTEFNLIKEYNFGLCIAKEYRHSSGATLTYINSDCNEKSFGVFFKTVPDDSTGVFHILEHSIVSGSKKYPIKSPFLYMLKNSMATYLNAITFQGKTGFLCASCNGKDFDNLMSVCLDAAFDPLLSRKTFRREGWNLSVSDGEQSIGGVVFNEMCGAMSSMDMQMYNGAREDLFPDTYQRYVAGGDPSEMTKLTYEEFLRTYKEFYRADGCAIFLSGNLDIDVAMEKIDEYLRLCPSGNKAYEYTVQKPTISKTVRKVPVPYRADGKSNAVLSYCIGDYGDEKTFIATDIVLNCLLNDNSSPLKRELIESGLVGDVYRGYFTECQLGAYIVLYNIKDGKFDTVCEIIGKHFAGFKTQDHIKRIEAIVAKKEFETEESIILFPRRGVHNFDSLADNVFYGLPLDCYYNAKVLREIKDSLKDNYFEQLIERVFLKNNHYARSEFKPVFGTNDYLNSALQNLHGKEDDETAASCQENIDTNDIKMPILKKEELEHKLVRLKTEVCGTEMVTSANTSGINYERFYFDASDFDENELSALGFMCVALGKLSTGSCCADELVDEIGHKIGRLSFNSVVTDSGKTYLRVAVAYLKSNQNKSIALLQEIISNTIFDCGEVNKLIAQEKSAKERNFATNPMSLALNGAQLPLSDAAACRYYTNGYGYYSFLIKESAEELCDLLVRVSKKLFVKARLLSGATGIKPSDLNLPTGESAVRKIIARPSGGFAYSIPAAVNCNAKAMKIDTPFSGKLNVVSRILSYGHLWKEVREKGNAYGTGFFFNNDGTCVANSFRDPAISKTYSIFDDCADYLINTDFGEDIDGYIVGAAAEFIKPLSIEEESIRNEFDILCGKSSDFAQQRFDEVLSFAAEDAVNYGKVLKNAKEFNICTAGDIKAMEKSGLFANIIKIGG